MRPKPLTIKFLAKFSCTSNNSPSSATFRISSFMSYGLLADAGDKRVERGLGAHSRDRFS